MEKWFKFYSANYKLGAFVIVFSGLVLYVLVKLFEIVSYPLSFLPGPLPVHIFLAFATIVAIPPLIGTFLSSNFVRRSIESLEFSYPKIYFLFKFLYAEDIKERKFPEVKIEFREGISRTRLLGFVVREWTDGGETWCRVAIPTFPLPATGNFIEKPKSELIYTGRQFSDAILTCLSFGTK